MPPQALMQQQLAAQRSAQQQSYAAQQAEAGSQRARTSGSRPAGNGWKPVKVSAKLHCYNDLTAEIKLGMLRHSQA
jgi:hypothetical protein